MENSKNKLEHPHTFNVLSWKAHWNKKYARGMLNADAQSWKWHEVCTSSIAVLYPVACHCYIWRFSHSSSSLRWFPIFPGGCCRTSRHLVSIIKTNYSSYAKDGTVTSYRPFRYRYRYRFQTDRSASRPVITDPPYLTSYSYNLIKDV